MAGEQNSASTVLTTVYAELAQLRAERAILLAEQEGLLLQLKAAKESARQSQAALEMLVAEAAPEVPRENPADTVEAGYEVERLRRERDLAREEVSRLRVDRDRLRIEMLNAELAAQGYVIEQDSVEIDSLRADFARVSAEAAALGAELDAHRSTISWRVTRPLRAVRRRQLRR